MERKGKTIDLIIPCFNEGPNILPLVNEIDRNIAGSNYAFKFIFIDDGSTDDTYVEMRKMSELREDISLIKLSRNFGKEAALVAGLRQAHSDAVIIIDADLQHPPHLIPAMIAEWEKGVHIVDAMKIVKSKGTVVRTLMSRVFNKIFSGLTGVDFSGSCDYKLLDKKAIEVLNKINENTRFFRGLTNWIGLRHTRVEFEVDRRKAGRTKWNLFSLFRLSIDAVASHSQKPLQIITVLGIFTLLFSLILGAQTLYNKLVGNAVSGFTTVILIILMLASCIMIGIGILGIYLSKIYEEIKGRPIYIIEECVGFKKIEESSQTVLRTDERTDGLGVHGSGKPA
jgi:glycosyltransferase involved in cell wall biosynthesis